MTDGLPLPGLVSTVRLVGQTTGTTLVAALLALALEAAWRHRWSRQA